MSAASPASRADALDWPAVSADLDAQGWAVLPKLLTGADCDAVAGLYGEGESFRSHVVMARHGFGRGEYRYFAYPLPPLVGTLRTALYAHLAPVAKRWHERMGIAVRFPTDHAAFIDRCHRAGQTRPTPLLLQYGPGDYNCLHQDLYGEHVFPLQVAIEEDVRLRDERVQVERRPVDRPADTAATAAFQDRTVEMTETGEEAVVQKTARVTEEVVVRKDVGERTEHVSDKVRRTEVEVEDGTGTTDTAKPDTARLISLRDGERRCNAASHHTTSSAISRCQSPTSRLVWRAA